MAIKFSQFVVETSASTMSHIVGYDGADNIQITPNNFFTSFVTGTTGQVPFFDSTTSLLGDAGFNWDNTNKRLGIGTSSPTFKLDVNSGTTNNVARFQSTDSVARIVLKDNTGEAHLSASGDDMVFATSSSGSQRMRITDAGNVGIGTNSPGTTLDVAGTLASSGITQLGTGGSNVLLTSASAGNVGIGSSSPSYKLDVYGDSSSGVVRVKNVANGRDTLRSENAAGTRTLNFGNDGSGNGIFIIRDSAGNVTNYITGSGDSYFNGGNVGIGIEDPVAKLHIYQNNTADDTTAGVTIEQDGTGDAALSFLLTSVKRWRLGIDNNDGDKFKISDATNLASSNRFTIDTSGNVGIGTTSPVYKLEVAEDTNGTANLLMLRNSDSTYAQTWQFQLDLAKDLVITGSSGSGGFKFVPGSRGATFAGDVTVGALTSGETAQLVINHEGGASPVAKFMSRTNRAFIQIGDNDTNGYLVAEGDEFAIGRGSAVSGNSIVIDASHNATFAGSVRANGWIKGASDTNTLFSNTSLGTLLQTPSNSGAGAVIHFRNTSGTDFQTFSQVDGSATFTGNVILNSRLTFDYGGDHYLESGTNTWAFKNSGGTTALQINHSNQHATFAGRVIIQDTDTESFRINGTSNTGSFVRYQTNGTNIGFFGAAYHLIGSSPAGYENDFGIRAESDLRFTIGASEKMSIINNGNVGIGTNTPTAKLTVVGLAEHADNAAAISAGLTTGAFYRTGDLLKVVH